MEEGGTSEMARAIVKRLIIAAALSVVIGGTLIACDEEQQDGTNGSSNHCQMIPIVSGKVIVWTEICT